MLTFMQVTIGAAPRDVGWLGPACFRPAAHTQSGRLADDGEVR